MKPMISKALVCGILASSFIIINCQKPPSRGVKAGTGDPNAKQAATQLPNCNEAVVASREARKPILKEVKDIVAAQKVASATALSDDKKIELSEKTDLLGEKTLELISKIRASIPAGTQAEGCTLVGNLAAGEIKDIKIADLVKEDSDLATEVSKLTGQSNAILDRAARMIAQGKEFLVKAALAELMSNKAAINGEKAISEGQIITKEQHAPLKANKDKTSCVMISASEAAIAADAKAKVMAIAAPQMDTASQRSMVTITFEAKAAGDSSNAVGFSCAMAQNKDINEELTLAFGDLLAVAAAPAAANETVPPQAPATTPTTPTAPVTPATEPVAPQAPATEPVAPQAPTPTPAPATEPTPAPATEPTPTPTPTPTPQVTQQQVQEAEALSALVQRLNQGQ